MLQRTLVVVFFALTHVDATHGQKANVVGTDTAGDVALPLYFVRNWFYNLDDTDEYMKIAIIGGYGNPLAKTNGDFNCNAECEHSSACAQSRQDTWSLFYLVHWKQTSCFGQAETQEYTWDQGSGVNNTGGSVSVTSSGPDGTMSIQITCDVTVAGAPEDFNLVMESDTTFRGVHQCACYNYATSIYCTSTQFYLENAITKYLGDVNEAAGECEGNTEAENIMLMIVAVSMLAFCWLIDVVVAVRVPRPYLGNTVWQKMCCGCLNVLSSPDVCLLPVVSASRPILMACGTSAGAFIVLSALVQMLLKPGSVGDPMLYIATVAIMMVILTWPIVSTHMASFQQLGNLLGFVYCVYGAQLVGARSVCYFETYPTQALVYTPSCVCFIVCAFVHLIELVWPWVALLPQCQQLGQGTRASLSLAFTSPIVTVNNIPNTAAYVANLLRPSPRADATVPSEKVVVPLRTRLRQRFFRGNTTHGTSATTNVNGTASGTLTSGIGRPQQGSFPLPTGQQQQQHHHHQHHHHHHQQQQQHNSATNEDFAEQTTNTNTDNNSNSSITNNNNNTTLETAPTSGYEDPERIMAALQAEHDGVDVNGFFGDVGDVDGGGIDGGGYGGGGGGGGGDGGVDGSLAQPAPNKLITVGTTRIYIAFALATSMLCGLYSLYYELVYVLTIMAQSLSTGDRCCLEGPCYTVAGGMGDIDAASHWIPGGLFEHYFMSSVSMFVGLTVSCDSYNRINGTITTCLLVAGAIPIAVCLTNLLLSAQRLRTWSLQIQKGQPEDTYLNTRACAETSQRVAMVKYVGMQTAYAIVGWAINTAILALATLIVVPVIYTLIGHEDAASLVLAMITTPFYHNGNLGWFSIILVNYFLLHGFMYIVGTRNSTLLNVTAVFEQVFYTLNGFASVVVRAVLSVAVQLINLTRLDAPVVPGKLWWMDAGFSLFRNLVRLDAYYSNRVMHAFVRTLLIHAHVRTTMTMTSPIFVKNKQPRSGGGHSRRVTTDDDVERLVTSDADDGLLISQRARNRWFLVYTLIKNPGLVEDRRTGVADDRVHRTLSGMLTTLMNRRESKQPVSIALQDVSNNNNNNNTGNNHNYGVGVGVEVCHANAQYPNGNTTSHGVDNARMYNGNTYTDNNDNNNNNNNNNNNPDFNTIYNTNDDNNNIIINNNDNDDNNNNIIINNNDNDDNNNNSSSNNNNNNYNSTGVTTGSSFFDSGGLYMDVYDNDNDNDNATATGTDSTA